jgi:hypothetical protein
MSNEKLFADTLHTARSNDKKSLLIKKTIEVQDHLRKENMKMERTKAQHTKKLRNISSWKQNARFIEGIHGANASTIQKVTALNLAVPLVDFLLSCLLQMGMWTRKTSIHGFIGSLTLTYSIYGTCQQQQSTTSIDSMWQTSH